VTTLSQRSNATANDDLKTRASDQKATLPLGAKAPSLINQETEFVNSKIQFHARALVLNGGSRTSDICSRSFIQEVGSRKRKHPDNECPAFSFTREYAALHQIATGFYVKRQFSF
jgi:hypothetical protein